VIVDVVTLVAAAARRRALRGCGDGRRRVVVVARLGRRSGVGGGQRRLVLKGNTARRRARRERVASLASWAVRAAVGGDRAAHFAELAAAKRAAQIVPADAIVGLGGGRRARGAQNTRNAEAGPSARNATSSVKRVVASRGAHGLRRKMAATTTMAMMTMMAMTTTMATTTMATTTTRRASTSERSRGGIALDDAHAARSRPLNSGLTSRRRWWCSVMSGCGCSAVASGTDASPGTAGPRRGR
jgi:hypothetical protein